MYKAESENPHPQFGKPGFKNESKRSLLILWAAFNSRTGEPGYQSWGFSGGTFKFAASATPGNSLEMQSVVPSPQGHFLRLTSSVPTLTRSNSKTPAECPTTPLNSDTTYRETASDFKQRCPTWGPWATCRPGWL